MDLRELDSEGWVGLKPPVILETELTRFESEDLSKFMFNDQLVK